MNNIGNNDKLDWMYKGASSQVDREEYLLGKSVDKTFEQLTNEEKEKKLGLVPPKNHVEHECIPPSIRDYNKIVQQEQVDLSAKLQEDPLVAIKKQEEDARRQFLQNPIQLKKLQEALKVQESKKKKKKQKKKKQSDSEDDLDRQLTEKLKCLKGKQSLTSNILKKDKKKTKDNHLDTILMHKFNQLKDKLSQKDLDDILEGKSSDSEDQKPKAKKQKKHRSASNSSYKSCDSDNIKQKSKKIEVKRDKSEDRKHKNYKEKKKITSKDYRKKRHQSNSSDSEYDYKNKYNKDIEKEKYGKNHKSRESDSKNKSKKLLNKSKESYSKNERCRSTSGSSDEKRKNIYTEQSISHKSDEDLDKMILERLRMLRDLKTDKTEEKEKESIYLKNYSQYDSDNDEYVVKKKSFGLVKSDGTKIPLKNPILEHKKTVTKPELPKAASNKNNKKLSDKEKEELRNQMLSDAVKRDKERSDNLKKHRQENEREESKIDDFDKNFVHRELSKSQSNIKDVGTRIRSKLNNIQRSTQHMNSNFSKRS